nr:MAG TPA: hypothetical protein [Caudoviricetes sp.]
MLLPRQRLELLIMILTRSVKKDNRYNSNWHYFF